MSKWIYVICINKCLLSNRYELCNEIQILIQKWESFIMHQSNLNKGMLKASAPSRYSSGPNRLIRKKNNLNKSVMRRSHSSGDEQFLANPSSLRRILYSPRRHFPVLTEAFRRVYQYEWRKWKECIRKHKVLYDLSHAKYKDINSRIILNDRVKWRS